MRFGTVADHKRLQKIHCEGKEKGGPGIAAREGAVRLDPGSANARMCLALALLGSGCHDDALAALDEALRIDASSPDAHNVRGAILVDMSMGAEAARVLGRRGGRSRQRRGHIGRATPYMGLGRHEDAAAAFAEAARVDPASADAHIGRGDALIWMGRRVEALAAYGEALRVDPRRVAPHAKMGRALLEMGRNSEGACRVCKGREERARARRGPHREGPCAAQDGQAEDGACRVCKGRAAGPRQRAGALRARRRP